MWLTPPAIVEELGPFDLDPCFGPPRPWDTAARHFGPEDNGLAQPWEGMVWCNPPYDREAALWLKRCADHGQAIALVFARTETAAFHAHVWERATAMLFLRGRLHFHNADGVRAKANGGAPSVLIGYGDEAARRLYRSSIEGAFVDMRMQALA